jgi:L-ascorbate metabolism protein UlaG (beta-lactamase superfamily)
MANRLVDAVDARTDRSSNERTVMKIFTLLALAALPAFAQGTGKGKTEVTWYGHAAFVVKTPGGTTLAIDPWINNPANNDKGAMEKIQKLDYILISHGHSDHVGDAVALQKKTSAKIVASFELGAQLAAAGVPKEAAGFETLANAGGILKLTDEVSVALVQAVHSSGFQATENGPILYAGSPVGFVVLIKGGPTLYHTGDTAYFGEMKRIGDRFHPDLLLACIGGHFTMDPLDAAVAAHDTGAKNVVPMHYGTFPILTGTPEQFAKALKTSAPRAKLVQLHIGETRAF